MSIIQSSRDVRKGNELEPEERQRLTELEQREPERLANLDLEERQRLFAHTMHEETVFYNRLNFFMVCESLLFAATISGLSGNNSPLRPIIIPMCVLGILVTLLWWIAQVNKLVLFKTLEGRVKEACKDLKESILLANRPGLIGMIHSWSASSILAHALPALFMLTWLYLLGY